MVSVRAPADVNDDRFAYSITYEVIPAGPDAPARVRCTSQFAEHKLLLDAGDIAAWQDMMKQLRVELDRSIVLKKP